MAEIPFLRAWRPVMFLSHRVMRLARALIPWILTCGFLAADELSQADRLALLEKIEKLQANAEERVDERYRVAVAAFRAAMTSDDGAIDLYVRCIEKTEFEDAGKRSHEFRDWKKKNAQRLQEVTFRMALRHQLAWLVLTLQQASTKGNKDDLPPKVNEEIESLFRDPRMVLIERETLGKSVTSTVFAKTYQLESVKADHWSMSPIHLSSVYDSVILPPLRRSDKLEELRNAWHRRILHESQLAGRDINSPPVPPEPGKPAPKDPFFTDTLPALVWSMEEDLFRNGDQRGAALRLYQQVEKYQQSPKASEWADRLKDLLTPPQEKPKDAPKDAPAAQ